MMPTNGAGPVEQIERALMQIGWLGQRRFMQLLAEERFDLTIPQYHTLLHLNGHESVCNMSELARSTQQSAASLTGVVDRLLDKRLVERVRPDIDRRQVMVTVTDRGRQLLSAIKHAQHSDMQAVLGVLEPAEIQHLHRLLDLLATSMRGLVIEPERR